MAYAVKCGSWICFNGEEYQCQWPKDHIGCHSACAHGGKIKWEKSDVARERLRDAVIEAARIWINHPDRGTIRLSDEAEAVRDALAALDNQSHKAKQKG